MTETTDSIKEGYKKTKLGWIPEDWGFMSIEDLSSKIMVGIASSATQAYRVTGVPMFRNQNIQPNNLDDSDLLYVDKNYELQHKNKRLRSRDVLVVRTGYPGTAAVVPKNYEGAQCFTSLIVRPLKEKLDSDFLAYFLNSPIGKRIVLGTEAGGAQKNINAGVLSKVFIAVPNIVEQQKIATILSIWDKAIDKLTQLIAAKEQRKKGLMQQLLTGKKRFAGFEDAWKKIKLGDVAKFSKGKGISKSDIVENGNTPCIRYGELYTVYKETIDNVVSSTNVDINDLFLSETDDVIIPASGETALDIATASCVKHPGIALGGDLNIIRSNIDGVFLSFYLNTAKKVDIARLAQGISVIHLYSSQLKLLKIDLPQKEEQQKIASVLSAADKEIELLKQELNNLHRQKKGLMQVLLTGEVRVKIN